MKQFVTQEMIAMWQQSPTLVLEDLAQAVFQAAVQEALKMLPIINESLIKQATALHKTSNEFYAKNPDLLSHKPFIAQLVETFEGQNPGMPMTELLPKVATEARSRLGLSQSREKKRLSELDSIVGGL